jgi:hypothetical protein
MMYSSRQRMIVVQPMPSAPVPVAVENFVRADRLLSPNRCEQGFQYGQPASPPEA